MIGGINNASYLKKFNLTVYLEILIIKYAEVFCFLTATWYSKSLRA